MDLTVNKAPPPENSKSFSGWAAPITLQRTRAPKVGGYRFRSLREDRHSYRNQNRSVKEEMVLLRIRIASLIQPEIPNMISKAKYTKAFHSGRLFS